MKLGVFRRLYALVPGKMLLFEPLRKGKLLPASVYRHLFVQGTMTIRTPAGTAFKMLNQGHHIETLLYWGGLEGGWEKVSARVWARLSMDAGEILDIGANTGIYSLIASSCNPKARVHAFEPVPAVFRLLSRNNELNDRRIQLYRMACGPEDGEATLYENSDNHYEASLLQDTHRKNRNQPSYQVQVRSVDSLIQEHIIGKVDLIKIDVEKFEPQVLSGFLKFKELLPSMLIEILDDSIARFIEDFVEGLGYSFFNVDEHRGLIPTNHLSKSATYNFLLLQPSKIPLVEEWIFNEAKPVPTSPL